MNRDDELAAAEAQREIRLHEEAFDGLEADMIQALLATETPEAAREGVMAVQTLRAVRQRVRGVAQTFEIQKTLEEQNG